MTLSLEKIAQLIGATLIGDSDAEINGISTLTMLMEIKYLML